MEMTDGHIVYSIYILSDVGVNSCNHFCVGTYRPNGEKVKHKAQLAKILGKKYDFSTFQFHKGTFAGGKDLKPNTV